MNNEYKHRYIAGSFLCSTKQLSKNSTSILNSIKDGIQRCFETIYSRSGFNQIWILKNSKELLEVLKSCSLSSATNIKTYDFFYAIYNSIYNYSSYQIRIQVKEIIYNSFFCRSSGDRQHK